MREKLDVVEGLLRSLLDPPFLAHIKEPAEEAWEREVEALAYNERWNAAYQRAWDVYWRFGARATWLLLENARAKLDEAEMSLESARFDALTARLFEAQKLYFVGMFNYAAKPAIGIYGLAAGSLKQKEEAERSIEQAKNAIHQIRTRVKSDIIAGLDEVLERAKAKFDTHDFIGASGLAESVEAGAYSFYHDHLDLQNEARNRARLESRMAGNGHSRRSKAEKARFDREQTERLKANAGYNPAYPHR